MTAPEVNALVEQWWRLAVGLARKAGDRYPWLSDDFESLALEALWRVAVKFGDDGDARFAGLLRKAVRWAVAKRLAQERDRNPLAFAPRVEPVDRDGEPVDAVTLLADDGPPVGAELEAADEVRAVLGRADIRARTREVFVRWAAEGERTADLAAEFGVSPARVHQLVADAREKLRAAVEHAG